MLSNLLLMWLIAATPDADVWPGFLGAGATPVKAEALPLTWSPNENIAWSADLPGHGQSSPVVWKGLIFATAVEGEMKDTCHVLALKLADGTQAWKHSIATSDPVKNSLYVSRAAPTPVVDAEHVFAYFESGDIVVLTHAGERVWQRSLSKEYGKFQNKFGLSASPVQTDDALIVLVDDEGPSYLIALAKRDGKTLWKTDRESRTSWSSPALVPVDGKPQVVVSSAGSVDGYDPATGKRLWSYTDVGGNTAATPIPYGDGRFLIAASPGQMGERAEDARKSNFAMHIERKEGEFVPTVLWRTEQATPSFASPMVHDGYAYWVNRQGVVYCFDVETGEQKYAQRTAQSCWATPLGMGNRVYFPGKDGVTTVLAAGPEFKVLAENRLWDPDAANADAAAVEREESEERRRAAAMFAKPTQYGIAAVGESLLIRTGTRLFCLRQGDGR